MAEISRQIDVAHSSVRNYVQQNRLPDADVLIKIASRTNVSLRWLLTGEGASREVNGLDVISPYLDPETLREIEEFREIDDEGGRVKSQPEYFAELISAGLSSRILEETEAEISEKLDETHFYRALDSTLRETIIRIVRHEIQWGKSRDIILEHVKRDLPIVSSKDNVRPFSPRPPEVQDLGSIDEFLAKEVEKHDNPYLVLEAWYIREGWPTDTLSAPQYKDWHTLTLEQKVKEIKAFRDIDYRHRKRHEMLSPKTPKDPS